MKIWTIAQGIAPLNADFGLKMLMLASTASLVGFAFHSRPHEAGFGQTVTDPKVESRIDAYVPIIQRTEKVLQAPSQDARAERALAEEWAAKTMAGELQPLPLQRVDDTMQNGVKSEIMTDVCTLSDRVRMLAKKAAAQGDFYGAAKDGVLSAQMLQCIRYSDVTSVALIGNEQKRTVDLVKTFLPHLDSKQRSETLASLQSIAPDPAAMEKVLAAQKLFDGIENIRLTAVKRASSEADASLQNNNSAAELDSLARKQDSLVQASLGSAAKP